MLLYIFFTEIYVTWLESARVARNRPSQITHLGCHLGRRLGFQTLAHPKC